MKFHLKRTSAVSLQEHPLPDCNKVDHEFKPVTFGGYLMRVRDFWVLRVKNMKELREFIEKLDKEVIIGKYPNKIGGCDFYLEIYDDKREGV